MTLMKRLDELEKKAVKFFKNIYPETFKVELDKHHSKTYFIASKKEITIMINKDDVIGGKKEFKEKITEFYELHKELIGKNLMIEFDYSEDDDFYAHTAKIRLITIEERNVDIDVLKKDIKRLEKSKIEAKKEEEEDE